MPERVSQVQRAIKQRRPFKTTAQEGLLGLFVVADRLRRVVAPVLEPHGITAQQYNVLRILRGAGPAGLPTLEIAERMIELTPGITRLLDRLETKHLVRRHRCPEDRRRVLCDITPGGLAVLEALDRPIEKLEQRALGMLSPQKQSQLVELVNTILAGVS